MKSDNLAKTYLIYFVILLLLILVRILASFGLFAFLGDFADYVFTLVIQVFILFMLSYFVFSKTTKKSKKNVLSEFCFNKISVKCIVLSVLIGFIVYFLNSYIASFFYFILSLFGFSLSGGQAIQSYPVSLLIVNIIFTAILPAICEETVHRGMLLSQIRKKSLGFAIIISSLLFGLLHINIYQFFYATILGFLLAVLTVATNSIYPAIIVHFMNNALNVYMSFASVNNLFSARLINQFFSMASFNNIFGVLFLVIFFIFLLFLLFYLYQALVKQTTKDRLVSLHNKIGLFLARKSYFKEVENIREGNLEKSEAIDLKDIVCFFNKNEDFELKNYEKVEKNSSFYEKLFLISSIVLSLLTTIFTFIWGVL